GRRVGILLDASAQHAGRRGREALAVSAHTMGGPGNAADGRLELVGLDETAARRRVGKYSLGMRQRLGFAHALLGDPEVLILDEPANGLDPEGMRWMRGLLRNFADRGGTVLLSSHLLAEVEAVADRMMIISGGRIQAQGTRAELLTESRTIVEADDLAGLDAALHRAGLATHPADGDRRLVEAEPEVVARELRKMVDTRAGFWLQVAMVALTVVVVVVRLLVGDAAHHTFQSVLDVGLQPAAVLLPVLGILLVTSEWSQRTGLITFALVPVRSRVLAAKLLASLVLAIAAVVVCLAIVVVGVLLAAPGVDGTWSGGAAMVGQSAVYVTASIVTGVAF